MTVPTAVAVVLSVLSECDGVTVSRTHEPHESRQTIVAMAREAYRMAPIASGWCGYQIPPEMAFVTAFAEGGFHNLNRDHVADPQHRSTGFFAMRPACWTKFARRVGFDDLLPRKKFDSDDEWARYICVLNRDFPEDQVDVYFTAAAYYLRANGGDVSRFFSIWRWGYPTETTYAARCAKIWRDRFGTYPPKGKLRKL